MSPSKTSALPQPPKLPPGVYGSGPSHGALPRPHQQRSWGWETPSGTTPWWCPQHKQFWSRRRHFRLVSLQQQPPAPSPLTHPALRSLLHCLLGRTWRQGRHACPAEDAQLAQVSRWTAAKVFHSLLGSAYLSQYSQDHLFSTIQCESSLILSPSQVLPS